MSRLSIWNSGIKANDYKFIDRTISENFGIGGTAAYLHLYQGVYQQSDPTFNTDGTTTPAIDASDPNAIANSVSSVTSIQDVLFLENRDRKYDPNVYELRTIYNIGDSDFDLRQFGMFLTNDTYFLYFHFNDMISQIGRKIMVGDVIELPHQRDEFQLNGGPATNKFYVVEDANRASDGYSITWWSHIWRVKCSPMPASQEYSDILAQQAVNPLGLPMTLANGTAATLGDLMSTLGTDLGLNEQIVDDAKANFVRRYFETQQFWYIPGTTSELGVANPWVFAGDGTPPDGALLVGQGNSFPQNPNQGDYYLRTDYMPSVLFMFDSNKWRRQEVDWRGVEWSIAHRHLKSFINNDNTTTADDGETFPEKVNLSKTIVRPGIDFT